MTTLRECWFCKQPIKGKAELHHVKPRRYHRKGTEHRRGNLVKVHTSCHRRFHFEVEDCRWKWWQFKAALEPLNFGEGIFAGD